jgi:hypothetical protein
MRGNERLVCVDPGLMTGVALIDRRGDDLSLTLSGELGESEVADWLRMCLHDWEKLEENGIVVSVVYERFLITMETAKNSQAPWSLEMIGVLKQVCRDYNYPLDLIYAQRPSEAKSIVTNAKLKRLGLWHKGGAGHALDAIRHGVLCLVKRGWEDSRLLG